MGLSGAEKIQMENVLASVMNKESFSDTGVAFKASDDRENT